MEIILLSTAQQNQSAKSHEKLRNLSYMGIGND